MDVNHSHTDDIMDVNQSRGDDVVEMFGSITDPHVLIEVNEIAQHFQENSEPNHHSQIYHTSELFVLFPY